MRHNRLLAAAFALTACSSGGDPAQQPPGSDLSGFAVERIDVGGVGIEAWIADEPFEQAQGFMNATAAQLAPLPDGTPRGMLFVFDRPRTLNFFMRDTFVPLDLAYAYADGTIFEVHELIPLDETPVPSSEPAQFVLEAVAGTFAAQGIGPGSRIRRPN